MVFESFDLWDESFWLPANLTWADMDRVRGKHQNSILYQDLVYPWIAAMVITMLRNILERKIFLPLGVYFQVKDAVEKAEHNVILEEAFKKSCHINNKKIRSLAKQTDRSEEEIYHWWSIRSMECKPSELQRFCERSWEALFYIYNFIFGVLTLWNKDWMWDHTKLFTDTPYQVEPELWLYYITTIGFYWSLLFSTMKDYKAKDFLELFIHHTITIVLVTIGRISHMLRFGSIVVMLHDCSDINLELAKIAKYIGYNKLSNALLILFTVVWMATRLYVYPLYVVLSLFTRASMSYPALYIMKFLLVMLLFVHIYWTKQIFHILRKVFFVSKHESRQQSTLANELTNSVIKDQPMSNGNHRKVE